MSPLYIVKTGSTFPDVARQQGDFEQWIAAGLGAPQNAPTQPSAVIVLDAPSSPAYPAAQHCMAVVISGSHAMVTDNEPWMQALEHWLHEVCMAGVPVLGICFGHQLLAKTLGGHVSEHPAGLEIGTVAVELQADVSQDPVWQHMPRCFDAQVVHYQSVRRLPQQACLLAANAHEPHHAFRWRDNVWGVQFHPEFSPAAMQAYIDHVVLDQHSHGATQASATPLRCAPTPDAAKLLRQFMLHALHRTQQLDSSSTQSKSSQTFISAD